MCTPDSNVESIRDTCDSRRLLPLLYQRTNSDLRIELVSKKPSMLHFSTANRLELICYVKREADVPLIQVLHEICRQLSPIFYGSTHYAWRIPKKSMTVGRIVYIYECWMLPYTRWQVGHLLIDDIQTELRALGPAPPAPPRPPSPEAEFCASRSRKSSSSWLITRSGSADGRSEALQNFSFSVSFWLHIDDVGESQGHQFRLTFRCSYTRMIISNSYWNDFLSNIRKVAFSHIFEFEYSKILWQRNCNAFISRPSSLKAFYSDLYILSLESGIQSLVLGNGNASKGIKQPFECAASSETSKKAKQGGNFMSCPLSSTPATA